MKVQARVQPISNPVNRPTQKLSLLKRIIPGLIIASCLVSSAVAQGLTKIKYDPRLDEEQNLKRMKVSAKRLSSSRAATLPSEDVRFASTFYEKYVPGKITNDTTSITELMNEVNANFSLASRSGSTSYRSMMGWIYNGFKPVMVGNCEPSARINSIMLISKLDVRPANRTEGTGPVPATVILTDLLPIYENEKENDGVRAAALLGLRRYCYYAPKTVTGQNLARIQAAMNALLEQEPPAGRDPAAHAVLQQYAIDILSSVDSGPQFGTQLVSISTEVKRDNIIALHSVKQIGSMGDKLGDVLDPETVLAQWAIRAMRVLEYEVHRLNSFTRLQADAKQPIAPEKRVNAKKTTNTGGRDGGIGMEDFGGGDRGGGGEDPGMTNMEEFGGFGDSPGRSMDGFDTGPTARVKQPPEVEISRRKVNYMLQQLHFGATGSPTMGVPSTPGGLMAAVDDDEKIKEWVTSMEGVLTAVNEPSLGERRAFIAALEEQIEALKNLAGEEAVNAAKEVPIRGVSVPRVKAAAGAAAPGASPVLDGNGVPEFPKGTEEMAFE